MPFVHQLYTVLNKILKIEIEIVTKYLKESETDKILFSNIFYLKQLCIALQLTNHIAGWYWEESETDKILFSI